MIKKYAEYINLTEDQCAKRIGPPMVRCKRDLLLLSLTFVCFVGVFILLYSNSDLLKVREFILIVGGFCGLMTLTLFFLLGFIEYDRMVFDFKSLKQSTFFEVFDICNEDVSCDEYRLCVLKNGRELKNFDLKNMRLIFAESKKINAENVCKQIHGIA